MTNCFKFLTLVGMLISLQVHMLYAAKAKAKDYDVKICWNNYDFGRVLDTVCDHGARKRSIKREGEKYSALLDISILIFI